MKLPLYLISPRMPSGSTRRRDLSRPRAIRKTATATITPSRFTASWESVSTISIRTLPAVYPLYHQDSAFLGYRTLKDVFHSSLFPMGNFSYILSVETSGSCQVSALQFAIREPMLALTPLNPANLPRRESCRCLYTVTACAGISPPS